LSWQKKKEAYEQYAAPGIKRTRKSERRAIAVYWPGFEPGGGLVFDTFDHRFHAIPRLWPDNAVPRDWTKWRAIDYGTTAGINACLWVALSPPKFQYQGITFNKSIAVAYRLLYERNYEVADTCREIIQRSHNNQVQIDDMYDPATLATYKCFREDQTSEQFYATILDSRSAKSPLPGATVDQVFERHGVTVTAASGMQGAASRASKGQIAMVQDWLALDMGEPHLTLRNSDGTPIMGAPHLYFFADSCQPLFDEIAAFHGDPENPETIPSGQADHAISTLRYFCADDPRYFGDQWQGGAELEADIRAGRMEMDREEKLTPFTGA
jgi:hypothetical protein